jgi:hypothetical protein
VAYVGNQPARGQWRKLSDISSAFDGVITTFTTSVPPGTSQYFVTAGSASQLLISLGGVIQEPDVDYTVSTNSVTFTTPPTSGLSFFGVLCGDALNAGVPSDGSVTTSKLAGGLSVGLTGGSVSTPSLFFTGDDNTGVFSAGADQLNIATNGVERVEFGTSEVVFNDGGANYDFRIEGDTNANLFFVDASAEAVGIGTTSPSEALHVKSTSGTQLVLERDGTTTQIASVVFKDGSGDQNRISSSDSNLIFESGAGNTERLRCDSSGRLLVGTSSSSEVNTAVFQGNSAAGSAANVTISSTLNNPTSTQTLGVLSFSDNSHVKAAQIECLRDGGTWTSGTSQPSALKFSTTADGASALTEAMRIDQAQRVAIGSAGGGRKFNVQSQNAAAFFSAPSDGSCPDMITIQCGTNAGDTTTRYINFRRQNGAIIGYVGMNGASAVNYSTSSDYRLKENVTPVSDGITRLQQLKPSRFNFIADPAKTVDGFLAHEVQTIVPEAITGEKDAVDDEGNPEYQGIDQSKLVPLLTAALQEAVAKIESLEARLTAAGL